LKIVVISVFSIDEEKGVLEALVHWGPITNFAERSILEVNDNIPVAISLGPITRDNNCNFVSRWKVPTTPITIVVCCELDRNIFTAVLLENIHGVFEGVSPTVVGEDKALQTFHDDWVKFRIALHPVVEGLEWIVYVELRIRRTVPATWNEGTKPVTKFTMDAECRRTSSTLIDATVHLNPK
jgi:hypothetical protein